MKKDLENKMKKTLMELKNTHNIIGIKGEFESEGLIFKEMLKLKEYTNELGLLLEIKIGGPEAIRDLKEVLKLEANIIVCPMIESCYAVEKFIKAVHETYKRKRIPLIYLNIETINGMKNLHLIKKEFENEIDGIVFGRTDMIGSLKETNVNCTKITRYLNKIIETFQEKTIIVGGKINKDTIPKNSGNILFETRKIVFKNSDKLDLLINLALEFELLFLEYRKVKYNSTGLEKRIKEIQNRL